MKTETEFTVWELHLIGSAVTKVWKLALDNKSTELMSYTYPFLKRVTKAHGQTISAKTALKFKTIELDTDEAKLILKGIEMINEEKQKDYAGLKEKIEALVKDDDEEVIRIDWSKGE